MIVTIIVSLYTVRIVLTTLGVEDYGIYNIVGGVVAMLSFLNATIASSTSRFLSHTTGSKDIHKLKNVFATSWILHFFIALIVVVILELIGVPLLKSKINIPEERLNAAVLVFHFSVIVTFITIFVAPFIGVFRSHENFKILTIIDIIEVLLKLIMVLCLPYVEYDKLIFYAGSFVLVVAIPAFIKIAYCLIKFNECIINNIWEYYNKKIAKEIMYFSGWSMFGSVSGIARVQGNIIIVNLFFGVIVNAAYGIANQINGLLTTLAFVVSQAINPRITKLEGSGNRKQMIEYSLIATKIPFILLIIMAVPIIIEIPYILKIWLGSFPVNTVIFARLTIVYSIVFSLSMGVNFAIEAIGRIKVFQIVSSCIIILNIPFIYLAFYYGYPAYYSLVINIFLEILIHFFKLIYLSKITAFPLKYYLINIDLLGILVIITVLLIIYISVNMLDSSFLRLIFTLLSSLLLSVPLSYFILLNNGEKKIFSNIYFSLKQKYLIKI